MPDGRPRRVKARQARPDRRSGRQGRLKADEEQGKARGEGNDDVKNGGKVLDSDVRAGIRAINKKG